MIWLKLLLKKQNNPLSPLAETPIYHLSILNLPYKNLHPITSSSKQAKPHAIARLLCILCICLLHNVDSTTTPSDSPSSAQAPKAAPPTLQMRTHALLWLDYENDANFDSRVDKYYTAGVRLGFISKESSALKFLRFASLQQFFTPSAATSFGLAIKQEMYAPKDRFSPIPPADDHPYGGYVGATFSSLTRSAYIFENLSIDLGLVGKASGAKEVQDLIHDLTNNAHLAGWGTQLRNEFILNAHWGISASIPQILEATAHSLDLMPQFSLNLGNARIHAQASLLMRFGYALSPNTAPMLINSGFVGAPSPSRSFCLYGFVGAGVRAVGRNIFLQGNTFAPHFAVEKTIVIMPFMAEFIWGGVLEYRRFMLTLSVVHRSKEFATQDGFHNFGLISLGVKI